MVHVYSEFVGRRFSRSKWLENLPKFALAMSYIVAVGFASFSLHKFSRISTRNALLFAISDNPMYTTSSTT